VKPRDGVDALEHDDLGIVEQPLPRHAAERARRARAIGTTNGRSGR
jgi:hypothetical protein